MVGAVERVRPKMMTVVAIMAGLLPIMWSTGTGSEVMQRIAELKGFYLERGFVLASMTFQITGGPKKAVIEVDDLYY